MKKYIIFAAAALALAACSNEVEENLDDSPVAARITAGVSTRAINDTWEADTIGVMVTSGNADMVSLYKNVDYSTTTQSTGTAEFSPVSDVIYFKGNDEITFAAYGPFVDSNDKGTLPGTNKDGVINSDANGTRDQNARAKQKAFDYIYAKATATRSNPKVDLVFNHVMTRLIINVTTSASDGFAATDVTSGEYYLSGLKHDGKFDVTTGTAEADGDVVNNWLLNDNTIKADSNDKMTFTAILYPQTLNSALGFEAKINGQSYKIEISPALEAGYSYSYNITVKKIGLEVSGCTINNWGDGGTNDVNALMK